MLKFIPRILAPLLPLMLCLHLSAQAPSPIGATIPTRLIVAYRSGVVPTAPAAHLPGARLLHRHDHLGLAILSATPSTRAALLADPAVLAVSEDRVVFAHTVTTRAYTPSTPDALYNSPQGWAVRQVGASPEAAWSITRGAGVRIAILDSGLDASHPDLAPNLALNLSEIDHAALPSPCDDGTPQDQQGHGTWAASLAAAALGPNSGEIAGVAPEATLLNIKVLQRMPSASTSPFDPTGCKSGQAAGLLSWVLQGIEDAITNHADIISLSLGTLVDLQTGDGAGLKATFDQVTHAAFAANIILVAAAGNDALNLSAPRYIELPAQARDVLPILASTNPACAENLLAGATCAPGPITLSYYSNFGEPLNALSAPGGSYPAGPDSDPDSPSGWVRGACSNGIPSTTDGAPVSNGQPNRDQSYGCFGLGHQQYVQAMGTSAAAPLAAGAAALIRAAHPTWTAAEVIAALRASATSYPGLPAPQINAAAALLPTPASHLIQTAPLQSH